MSGPPIETSADYTPTPYQFAGDLLAIANFIQKHAQQNSCSAWLGHMAGELQRVAREEVRDTAQISPIKKAPEGA